MYSSIVHITQKAINCTCLSIDQIKKNLKLSIRVPCTIKRHQKALAVFAFTLVNPFNADFL